MSWLLCTLEPVDVLANADTRGVGYGAYGQSGTILPQTVAGALRAHILRQHGFEFGVPCDEQEEGAKKAAEYVGHPGAPSKVSGEFRFAGPFIWRSRSGELYFPGPAAFQYDEHGYPYPLVPETGHVLCDNELGGAGLLKPSDRNVEEHPCLVDIETLVRLLKLTGSNTEYFDPGMPPGRFYAHERRWGHKRGIWGSVDAGGLYSLSTRRFYGVDTPSGYRPDGLAGLVRAAAFMTANETAMLPIGGKGHLAALTVRKADVLLKAIADLKNDVLNYLESKSSRGVVLYLATPAFFEDGWHPNLTPENAGMALRYTAVGPALPISGWDMASRRSKDGSISIRGRPKTVRRAVNAGACYFYDIADPITARNTVDRWHFNASLSSEDGPLGYGIALFSPWRKQP